MILTTIDQFRAAVPTVGADTEFTDLQPYCNSAELWIRNQVLGAGLYAYVDGLQNAAETDLSLLQLCLNVVANHAYWDAIPFLDLVHTNSGFGVINNQNKAPASKERVERLREQCLIRRDNEVENLIVFLEQNTTYHDNWKGSPVYSVLTDCLIRTADELKRFSNWTGTRKDFLMLKPTMIRYTIAKLHPVFSKVLVEELIESQRDNDLSADERTLVEQLKYVLGSIVANEPHIATQVAGDALRFIDENLASFPIYTGSKEYAARIAADYVNDTESPIFSSLF